MCVYKNIFVSLYYYYCARTFFFHSHPQLLFPCDGKQKKSHRHYYYVLEKVLIGFISTLSYFRLIDTTRFGSRHHRGKLNLKKKRRRKTGARLLD